MKNSVSILAILKSAASKWQRDNAQRAGAALAYYSVFSISPLLIIVIAVAALVFGRDAAEGRVIAEIGGLIGTDGAKFIQEMIRSASESKHSGIVATIGGVFALIFGSIGVFSELQGTFDDIWRAPRSESNGPLDAVRKRWVSFMMVLGLGFLLLVSLILSAAIAGFQNYLSLLIPFPPLILELINTAVSLFLVSALFAMIFKYLPSVTLPWRDVWVGALMTAILFSIGKFLIGFYLGRRAVTSAYGAAGSIVVILVWAYYTAQILIYGAEFTYEFSHRRGSRSTEQNKSIDLRTS